MDPQHGDEGYLQGVSAALALLKRWQQRGARRESRAERDFHHRHPPEAQFWQMGLNAAAETRA